MEPSNHPLDVGLSTSDDSMKLGSLAQSHLRTLATLGIIFMIGSFLRMVYQLFRNLYMMFVYSMGSHGTNSAIKSSMLHSSLLSLLYLPGLVLFAVAYIKLNKALSSRKSELLGDAFNWMKIGMIVNIVVMVLDLVLRPMLLWR